MAEAYPTFKFWDLIERLEAPIFIFCRAHRQKKFPLYVEALEQLMGGLKKKKKRVLQHSL